MSASKKPSAPAWTDPDDAPDLSAPKWQDKMDAAPVVRPRGRPPAAERKVPTNIRLSASVLNAFKETGPGWQTRIEAALQDTLARLKREKGMPSSGEAQLLQRHKADMALNDLADPEYLKRALEDMIKRGK